MLKFKFKHTNVKQLVFKLSVKLENFCNKNKCAFNKLQRPIFSFLKHKRFYIFKFCFTKIFEEINVSPLLWRTLIIVADRQNFILNCVPHKIVLYKKWEYWVENLEASAAYCIYLPAKLQFLNWFCCVLNEEVSDWIFDVAAVACAFSSEALSQFSSFCIHMNEKQWLQCNKKS